MIDALSRSLAVGSYGLTRAMALAWRRYLQERDRSARRRLDGALEELPLNVAEALSTFFGEARNVPRDVARSLETREVRRMIRRSLTSARLFDRRLRRTVD
jgi:hypothetical protein